jgi:RNA polymerase sigma-70 factor (ECF subfamily)
MSAWLITILRNLFRTEYRKRRREVEDATAVTSIA